MRNALTKPVIQQFYKFAAVGIPPSRWTGRVIALTELFHVDYLVSTSISFIVSVAFITRSA